MGRRRRTWTSVPGQGLNVWNTSNYAEPVAAELPRVAEILGQPLECVLQAAERVEPFTRVDGAEVFRSTWWRLQWAYGQPGSSATASGIATAAGPAAGRRADMPPGVPEAAPAGSGLGTTREGRTAGSDRQAPGAGPIRDRRGVGRAPLAEPPPTPRVAVTTTSKRDVPRAR